MTIEEQISEWVKKEKEELVLNWLKQASDKERRALAPHIKKLIRYYTEYIEAPIRGYHRRGTDKQDDILQLAAYVCYNKADYLKSHRAYWIIDPKQLDKVKSWYHPDWFSDLLNREAESEFMVITLNYPLVLQLTDEGLLQPSHRLWARSLSTYIFQDKKEEKHRWVYEFKPEKLLERPETLNEHIWYFFEEDTELHLAGRYNHYGENADLSKIGWIPALTQMAAAGKIDRQRLLRESLLASNKNFNKNLSGFYMDLFCALFPSTAELITLQAELISVLNSAHSKVVNEAIQFLKTIAGDQTLDTASILAAAPVFLNSKTKTTVSGGLMLLEQIAKKHAAVQKAIATVCTQALVHADEGLQTRAAKLISRYGDTADTELHESLQTYQEGLLRNTRDLLQPFLNAAPIAVDERTTTTGDTLITREKTPVEMITNTDELIFLAAQAFDNNDALHLDLLPAALVSLAPQLKGDLPAQLQPALQRALQLTRNNFRSTEGYYDHMLGIFFIDVCIHLARKYPEDTKALTAVFDKFDQKEGDTVKKWMNIGINDNYISTWNNHYKDPYYLPRKQWLTDVLQKIRSGDTLPLLSTPTHYPGWIDPLVLTERIILHVKEKQLPDKTDLLMALGRVDLLDTAAALQLTKAQLTGEWQDLLVFLFTPAAEPAGEITQAEAWIVAALSKRPLKMYEVLQPFGLDEYHFRKYTGQYEWNCLVEEFERDEWKWEGGKPKTIKVKDQRKVLRIRFYKEPEVKESSGVKGLLEKLKWKQKEKKQVSAPLLYDYYEIKSDFFSNEHNDLRRAMLMAPANLEAFLPTVIDHCMSRPLYIGEGDKKMTLAALQLLYETWSSQGEMAHLFLALSILSADKTIAQTAAELWLRYAPSGEIDMALTGKIIGIIELVEFAPLKRFNDLAVQSLFRVSAQHNRLLETMIGSILAELPAEPIKHLKKLLELYKELYLLNQSGNIPEAVALKLKEWKGNSGLAKLIEGILGN